MPRMQEMTFPGFKFQIFSGGVLPKTPPFMRGILATHVAFSHCYPPLIYYLIERSLFKKCPPTGKSLKKALKHNCQCLELIITRTLNLITQKNQELISYDEK